MIKVCNCNGCQRMLRDALVEAATRSQLQALAPPPAGPSLARAA